MNSAIKSVLLLAAVFSAASSATAQVVLQNFSAFESPNTFFTGTWELNGDVGGSSSPRATFSQGAGVYNFVGGMDAPSDGAFYFFDSPLDITGLTLLQVTARVLPDNLSPSFVVQLFDSVGNFAFVTAIDTSSFAGPGFTTREIPLFLGPVFNAADLFSFQISGLAAFGQETTFNMAFDNLAVVAPKVVGAVPEPATYGLFASMGLLGAVAYSRRRRVV